MHAKPEGLEEYTILENISKTKSEFYKAIFNRLIKKPIFMNVSASMEALKKYINKSQAFTKLFSVNLLVFLFFFLLIFIGVITGIARDKAIVYVILVMYVTIIIAVLFLRYLIKFTTTKIILDLYKKVSTDTNPAFNTIEWQFLTLGVTAMSSQFHPLVNYVSKNTSNDSSSGGNICGSSCSSSSGSSCGGCSSGGGGD